MNIMSELKNVVKMEVRETSTGTDYLEAVVERNDLASLVTVLTKNFGKAFKSPGENPQYPKHIKGLVDSFGGLRKDQSFYYKEIDNKIMYAALWPWQSNSTMTTVKVGIVDTPPRANRTGFDLFAIFRR